MMRFSTSAVLLLVTLIAGLENIAARKAPRSAASSRRGPPASRLSRESSLGRRRPPVSKRRNEVYDDDEDDYDMDYEDTLDDEEDDYDEDEIGGESDDEDEEEEEDAPPRRRSPGNRNRRPPPKKSASRRSRGYDDEYSRPRRQSNGRGPPGRGRGGPPRGRRPGRNQVVTFAPRRPRPSTFSRGLDAIRKSMPDPTSVKEAAIKSLSVARETTSGLSANLYREVKGLTSSELEQVMLKATRPDDTPVKGKHAERLVGVTYQISGRYDIYDAVLRKLWAKMAEKDWRTTTKALYILHRFSADGSPEHAPALKVSIVGGCSFLSSFVSTLCAAKVFLRSHLTCTISFPIVAEPRLVYENFVVQEIRNVKANFSVRSYFKLAILLKRLRNTVHLWEDMHTMSYFEPSALEVCLTKSLRLQPKTARKRKLHLSPLRRHH